MANPSSELLQGQNAINKNKSRFRDVYLPVALGVVLAYLVYFLILRPHPGFPKSMDYTSWLVAGKMAAEGHSDQVYDLASQAFYQKAVMYPYETPGGMLIFYRPPSFILPFIPLSRLPFLTGYLLWVVSILATGALALWMIIRYVRPVDPPNPKTWLGWLFVSLAFFPVFQGILLGQTSLLELFILAAFYLLLRHNHTGWAGAVLALASFKPQLLIFFVQILILRRAWRGLAGFALVGLAAVGISIWLVGVDGLFEYLRVTDLAYGWNCTNGVYPEYHQSWRGLLVGMLVPSCAEAGLSSAASPGLNLANQLSNILNIFTTLVLAAAWWKIRKAPNRSAQFDLLFALTLLVSILASPYSNPQELTRLVLCAALVWRVSRLNHGLIRPWFKPRQVATLAVIISPLVMTPIARPVHPFVWVELLILVGLLASIFHPDFSNPPGAPGQPRN